MFFSRVNYLGKARRMDIDSWRIARINRHEKKFSGPVSLVDLDKDIVSLSQPDSIIGGIEAIADATQFISPQNATSRTDLPGLYVGGRIGLSDAEAKYVGIPEATNPFDVQVLEFNMQSNAVAVETLLREAMAKNYTPKANPSRQMNPAALF